MAVHPRLRGELFKMDALARQISGSSPLARGTRYAVNTDVDFSRFIPACAGNSVFDRSHDYKTTVHPRLRGELLHNHILNFVNGGSSPLARGTQLEDGTATLGQRFIPACAGNSRYMACGEYGSTVHPRLRGELPLLISNYRVNHGSSPLARGTHLKWLQHYTNRLTAKLLKNISKQE